VNPEIYGDKCVTEFGNPSGHACVSSFFSVYLFMVFFFEPQTKNPAVTKGLLGMEDDIELVNPENKAALTLVDDRPLVRSKR